MECSAGFLASLTAAPIIMAIDKAVVESSSGQRKILNSLAFSFSGMLKNPI